MPISRELNRFEIVGASEERAQIRVEALLILHEPGKLALHAAMPLDDLASVFEDQRLRRVEPSEIGCATGLVGPTREHSLRLVKSLA